MVSGQRMVGAFGVDAAAVVDLLEAAAENVFAGGRGRTDIGRADGDDSVDVQAPVEFGLVAAIEMAQQSARGFGGGPIIHGDAVGRSPASRASQRSFGVIAIADMGILLAECAVSYMQGVCQWCRNRMYTGRSAVGNPDDAPFETCPSRCVWAGGQQRPMRSGEGQLKSVDIAAFVSCSPFPASFSAALHAWHEN